MSTELVDTKKVYYAVKWRGITLEYRFKNNDAYLQAVASAEDVIVIMMREREVTIPGLRSHISVLLDTLAHPLIPLSKAIENSGVNSFLTPSELAPIWKEKMNTNFNRWFEYYCILRKLKYTSEPIHYGIAQLVYEGECGIDTVCDICNGVFERFTEQKICEPCLTKEKPGAAEVCEVCDKVYHKSVDLRILSVPCCGPCAEQLCSFCEIDISQGSYYSEETKKHYCEELCFQNSKVGLCSKCQLTPNYCDCPYEEPVQKKKNEKIGLCEVCVTETHRRCPCFEIYYCSEECSKDNWKTHKKTCSYKKK